MTYDNILLETYTENIQELEIERAGLTYYPGYDGWEVERAVPRQEDYRRLSAKG